MSKMRIPKQDEIEIEAHDDGSYSLSQAHSEDGGTEHYIVLADREALKRLASMLWNMVKDKGSSPAPKLNVDHYFAQPKKPPMTAEEIKQSVAFSTIDH